MAAAVFSDAAVAHWAQGAWEQCGRIARDSLRRLYARWLEYQGVDPVVPTVQEAQPVQAPVARRKVRVATHRTSDLLAAVRQVWSVLPRDRRWFPVAWTYGTTAERLELAARCTELGFKVKRSYVQQWMEVATAVVKAEAA